MSVVGVVILGGLIAVAVARSRRANGPMHCAGAAGSGGCAGASAAGAKLWRGYVSWQRVAESSTTAGTVALSPSFRARGTKEVPAPVLTQNEAARKAIEALQAMLEAYGWERVGGGAWDEGRFRRRT